MDEELTGEGVQVKEGSSPLEMSPDPDTISLRYKTMPIDMIDADALARQVCDEWKGVNNDREDFMTRREEWVAMWRDLIGSNYNLPFEGASDFHIPLVLIYGKAIHARLWQLFSDPSNFFGVRARLEAFEAKEENIKNFMQFILTDYANSRMGTRDVFDEWLWDVVFEGSGFLKLYWHREVHEYTDVVPKLEARFSTVFDKDNLTGRDVAETTLSEKEVERFEVLETPHLKRMLLEDVGMPVGESDPQTSRWVTHSVTMTDEDLKTRARDGKFFEEQVEEAIQHRTNQLDATGDQNQQFKQMRKEIDGYYDSMGYTDTGFHVILERYGKVYVEEKYDDDMHDDLKKFPREVVCWVHQASGRLLGWTFLHRISPGGIRPVFKGDFIRFPERNVGVGVGEFVGPQNKAADAVYNLRMDSGILASTPMGVYRSNSNLKPQSFKVQPGTMFPVDDPQNDVRIFSFPFLTGFGSQEEDRINSYIERGLSISDLQLGRTPTKVGAMRTASGANQLESASGIQLEIHFDRLARPLRRCLQALFRLCRERVPAALYFRITGEDGAPIFGKVDRENLRGEYDFEINVDVLGQTRLEQQQQSVLLMQSMINPALMQTGVVGPKNLYAFAKNFLIKHRVRGIDNYLTAPQDYEGPVVTPEERVMRIVVGGHVNPPIEGTVRLGENHERALQVYDAFKQSEQYGWLGQPSQIAALESLIQKHQQMMAALAGGANPNLTGMQVPRDGFQNLPAQAGDMGALGAPQGEVNGPVV